MANVYWINTVAGGQIARCGINGSCIPAPVVASAANGRALAIDDLNVYYADSQQIFVAPKSGIPDGGVGTVLAPSVSNVSAIAVDPTGPYVYVTTLGTGNRDGSVLRFPKAGGGMTTVATGQGSPKGIAVDDAFVYWTCADEGTVKKAPKPTS
jgi:hypothetical protein